MKHSTIILSILLTLLISSVFASNFIFKTQYDKVDKSDIYWNYIKISDTPFKHIKIIGGNVTNIVFEKGPNSSVRVLNYWESYKKNESVKSSVKNDTLFLTVLNRYEDLGDKNWMQGKVLIRVTSPELLSFSGENTNFEIAKSSQIAFKVNLSGKSRFELESNLNHLDSLNIIQSDSSQVVFEVSPKLNSSQFIQVDHVSAKLDGKSLLDIGHLNVKNIKLKIGDSSAVILSGKTLEYSKQFFLK